jgi:hypothetical protein
LLTGLIKSTIDRDDDGGVAKLQIKEIGAKITE